MTGRPEPHSAESRMAELRTAGLEDCAQPRTLPEPERYHVSWETYLYLRREVERLQTENARLQAECDHWYVASHYSRDEIAEMRRRASYEGKQINWSTGAVA